jgi:pyruvate/2-oxoacid:ferredoxin oxidoreductase beta subunit
MPIDFACECGRRFRVRDEYAGKQTHCPGCGSGLVVPTGMRASSGDTIRVRRERKVLIFSGCNSHPATGSLQPVAIEATRGGNETVGAFETNGSL